MAAGSIVIDLLMKTGAFETDVKRAEKALKNFQDSAGTVGKWVGGAIAAVAGAAALMVKSQIDAADAANKAAQAAGVSTEAYTALAYAAKLNDVEQETLGKTFTKINGLIAENSKELQALGISTKDAAGKVKTADVVLGDLADRFSRMKDGAEKSALAGRIFGERFGPKLLPMLNLGRAGIEDLKKEAERLGVVISTETGQAAEQFNDNLTRMTTAITGVATKVAAELLPKLVELSEQLLQNAKDVGFFQGAFVTLFQQLLGGTDPVDILGERLKKTEDGIASFQEEIAVLGNMPGQEARISFLVGELDKLQKQAAATGKELEYWKKADALAKPKTPAGTPVTPPAKPDAKVSEAQRYLENLQKAVDKARDLSAVEQALSYIQHARLDGITPKLREQILLAAQSVDMAKASASRLDAERKQEEERIEFIKKGLEDEMRLRQEVAQIAKQSADAHAAEIEQLIKGNEALREEAAILAGGEDARKAIEKARLSSTIALKEETLAMMQNAGASEEQIQALEQEIRLLKERAELLGQRNVAADSKAEKDAAKQRSETLADSIEEGILEGSRRGLDIMEIFREELKAQFAKTILRPIIQPVAEAINQGIGMLLSSAMGSFAGKMAGGGTIGPGQYALVGENGPELWSAPGTITPLDYSPAQSNAPAPMGGGGPVFNLKIETRPGESAEVTRSRNQSGGQDVLVRMVEKAVEQKFSGDMATGGPIARSLQNNTGVSRAPMLVR